MHKCQIILKSMHKWTNPDRRMHADMHAHTPKCNCNNYVSLTASMLDKNRLEKKCVHRTLMPPPRGLSKIAPWWNRTNGWKTKSLYCTIPAAGPTTKLRAGHEIYLSLCINWKWELWTWHLTWQDGSCIGHTVLSWWSFVPNNFQIPECRMTLWAEHKMPMQKLWVWTVTLTFDLATWFLHVTHYLVVMIISANKISNPTNVWNEVMGWTRFWNAYTSSVGCDLDLWPRDMISTCDISSGHDDHFCTTIFKSHYAWWSYGSDMNLECTNFKYRLWPWSLT